MAIETVRSGNHYYTRATSCPVCGEPLGEYQTMARHIVSNSECREELAGDSIHD